MPAPKRTENGSDVRSDSGSPSPKVSPAAPHERMAALRVLFGARSATGTDGRAERCRDALASGDHDPAGLLAARDAGGRIVGAVLAQPMPGALGVVWPPRAESAAAEDALSAAACDWLRSRGVKVAQAFAPAGDEAGVAPLGRAGFRRVTELVFLRRALHREPPPAADGALAFVVESLPFSAGFRAALVATQEDTRDCPELNAGRTPGELLAGFLDPVPGGSWHLATRGRDAAGVVLLVPGAGAGEVDLSYLGVVPALRGRGLGGELLRFALAEAALSGAAAVTLSVDARNEPALRLYRRHAFAETERRGVWLAHLGT